MRSLNNKKGDLFSEKSIGLILGVAAVAVLLMLSVNLLNSGKNKQELTSDNYFNSFMREVKLADDGQKGEFTMWQDGSDVGKQDVFLIYFGDKFSIDLPNDMSFITYGRKNIVCVCFWNGEEGICKDKNCENLEYPMKFQSSNGLSDGSKQWYIGNRQGITIERNGEEYEVNEVQQ